LREVTEKEKVVLVSLMALFSLVFEQGTLNIEFVLGPPNYAVIPAFLPLVFNFWNSIASTE
jgi:hypothetical protein